MRREVPAQLRVLYTGHASRDSCIGVPPVETQLAWERERAHRWCFGVAGEQFEGALHVVFHVD